jgi:hypothetical protein
MVVWPRVTSHEWGDVFESREGWHSMRHERMRLSADKRALIKVAVILHARTHGPRACAHMDGTHQCPKKGLQPYNLQLCG